MRHKILSIIWVVMMVFMCACGQKESEDIKSSKNEDKKIQIGMCFDSFVIERWQRDRDVFVSMAKEMGAEVNVQNANGDVEVQKEQIDYFISKDVDAIVIVCIDSDSLTDSVKKAKDAGIKVIAYDRMIKNANVDLYISFDNEQVGVEMGNALIDKGLVEGNVLILGGSPSDNNVPQVEGGFTSVMNKHGINILDVMHADGWRAELAGEYIYSHPEIIAETNAIMCGNDNLASQVVHALTETRMAEGIMVVGQDADLEACQRIVEDTQVMTVYKPVEKLASRAAESTIALVKGEAIAGEDVSTANDGTYMVPYVKLEPIAVNKNNIDEVIIGSGFHLKEDVYLNVPEKMLK